MKWPPENRVLYSWKYAELDCLVLAGPLALCGYVQVPKSHPLCRKRFEVIDRVRVHGGLTFSYDDEHGTWFGFDCAHAWDVIGVPFDVDKMRPEWNVLSQTSSPGNTGMRMWTISDVAMETCSLALQLGN